MKFSAVLLINYKPEAIVPHDLLIKKRTNVSSLNRYETLIKYLSIISPDIEIHVITESRKIRQQYIKVQNDNIIFHFIRREPYNFAPFYFFIPGILRIKSLLRIIKPDIVIAFGTDEPYGWQAACSGYPFIIYMQGIINKLSLWLDWNKIRKKFMCTMEKHVIARAAGAIAENEFANNWLLSNNKSQSDIAIIPNCLQDFFINTPIPSENRKKEIWCIGELSRIKNPRMALAAFIKANINNSKIHFAGTGPLEKELKNIVARENISNKCFFHGWLAQSSLAQHLHNATAIVLASQMDSSPNIIIESLALGTPVIATRTGGIPYIVQEGTDAILVKPDDIAEMADAIGKLLNNPPLAHKMGIAGRTRILKKHSPLIIAQAHIEFYQSIVNRLRSNSYNKQRK